jgi:hypothetical protein
MRKKSVKPITTSSLSIEDGWEEKYMVAYDISSCKERVWAVYSRKWRNYAYFPYKKISQYFSSKEEAEKWIRDRWVRHIDNHLERSLLDE